MRHFDDRHTQCLGVHSDTSLHRHDAPYAALVLSGGYEEVGLDGRFSCGAGTLVVHPSFHAHANVFDGDCEVYNIPLSSTSADRLGYQVFDKAGDWILTERDAESAIVDFASAASPVAAADPPEWLQTFLKRVLAGSQSRTAAQQSGVSHAHAIRMCRRWFGMTPGHLRREKRVHEAIRALAAGERPADVAVDLGFYDQPHLTRTLQQLIRRTPSQIRG